jgi:hypothetical protein
MGRRQRSTVVGTTVLVVVLVGYETAKESLRVVELVIVAWARLRKEEGKQRHPRHRSLPLHPQRSTPENTYTEHPGQTQRQMRVQRHPPRLLA